LHFIQVTVDAETNAMLKKRLGEDFAAKIADKIEIKAAEVARRDAKGGKRKPRGDFKGERKPREQK